MGEEDKKWIVVLNRIPSGPFTTAEVLKLQLEDKIRNTDVGWEVLEESDSEKRGEWKLLWQFPEFDRRKNENIKKASSAKAHAIAQQQKKKYAHRRRVRTPEDIEKEIKDSLNLDLIDISFDDLLSQLPEKKGFVAPIVAVSQQSRWEKAKESAHAHKEMMAAVVGIMCICLIVGLVGQVDFRTDNSREVRGTRSSTRFGNLSRGGKKISFRKRKLRRIRRRTKVYSASTSPKRLKPLENLAEQAFQIKMEQKRRIETAALNRERITLSKEEDLAEEKIWVEETEEGKELPLILEPGNQNFGEFTLILGENGNYRRMTEEDEIALEEAELAQDAELEEPDEFLQ